MDEHLLAVRPADDETTSVAGESVQSIQDGYALIVDPILAGTYRVRAGRRARGAFGGQGVAGCAGRSPLRPSVSRSSAVSCVHGQSVRERACLLGAAGPAAWRGAIGGLGALSARACFSPV